MPLQKSGAISLSNIASEFGDSAPHSMSEFYDKDYGVPTSGTIDFADFYGKEAWEAGNSPSIMDLKPNISSTTSTLGYQKWTGLNGKTGTSTSGGVRLPNDWYIDNTKFFAVTINGGTGTAYPMFYNGGSSVFYAQPSAALYSGSHSPPTSHEGFWGREWIVSFWYAPRHKLSADGDTSQMIFGGYNTALALTLEDGYPQIRLQGYASVNSKTYQYATSPDRIINSYQPTNWAHTYYNIVACCYSTTDGNNAGDHGGSFALELWVNNVLKARTIVSITNSAGYNFFRDWESAMGMYHGMYIPINSAAPSESTLNNYHNSFSTRGYGSNLQVYDTCPVSDNTTIGNSGGNRQVNSIWNNMKAVYAR